MTEVTLVDVTEIVAGDRVLWNTKEKLKDAHPVISSTRTAEGKVVIKFVTGEGESLRTFERHDKIIRVEPKEAPIREGRSWRK